MHLKESYRAEFNLTHSELLVERSKKTPTLKPASLSTRRFAALAYFLFFFFFLTKKIYKRVLKT